MDFSTVTHISYSNAGIDTDTIVQKLMQAEQVPLDQLKQKQQKDLWLSDAYRQWNTDLFSFNGDTVFNMKMSSNYDTFDVNSSLSDSVSATGTANAVEGTYNLTVKQIAQSATLTGNTSIQDSTKSFKDLGILSADTSINLSVNSDPNNPLTVQTVSIPIKATDTINDVVSNINKATDSSGKSLGVKAIYDSSLNQFILKTKATGAATRIDLTAGVDANGNPDTNAQNFLNSTLGLGEPTVTGSQVPGNVTINPAGSPQGENDSFIINLGNNTSDSITLKAGTYNTAQDYVNEINVEISKSQTLKGNVLASLDSAGRLVFSSKVVGNNILTVTSSASNMAPPPGFSSNSMTGTMSAIGSNADIIFNNKEITTFSTNNINILGVTYTLKSPTVDSSGNPISSTITVNRDVDNEVKNIEGFISKYNDMLSKLNTASAEPVYKDYQPLTDDQRSQMSDTQITQWETKAKSGLMNNDSILAGLVNKMRNAMTSFVNNGSTYNSLASIGITSHSYTDQGKLYVDEDKLRAALQNDPDGVKNLFIQTGTGVGNQGVIQSLSDSLNDAYNQLVDKAGSTSGSQYDQSFLGKDLSSLQTQISDMTTLLQAKEQSYYNQYDAMQQAVQQFQSQGTMLAQSLGLSTSTAG